MLFRLLSVCYFLTSQFWCFCRQNSCRIGSIKMGLYVVREWMGFHLCCVKPRVGETSKGTAETPGSWGMLVTDQCVLQNQILFFFWKSVAEIFSTVQRQK